MKIPATARLATAALLSLSLCSCANTSHLFVYQHATCGINAGTNPQTGNIHINIGLRRDFACVIPKIRVPDDSSPAPATTTANSTAAAASPIMKNQAASSYVASRVRVRGPFEVPDVAEFVATGESASNLAQRSDALTPFAAPNVATTAAKTIPATTPATTTH